MEAITDQIKRPIVPSYYMLGNNKGMFLTELENKRREVIPKMRDIICIFCTKLFYVKIAGLFINKSSI
jgi:hypothetical protein